MSTAMTSEHRRAIDRGELSIARLETDLKGYVDSVALSDAWQKFRDGVDAGQIHYAYILSVWLRQMAHRPLVPDK